MNESNTAFKSREQFGIQASQDTLLSEIGRSLHEDIKLKKTEERLCRHLAKAGLDEKIHLGIVEDAKRFVGERTIISIDPTDIQKDYAEKMPYLDSEGDEVQQVIMQVALAVNKRGIYVYARGGADARVALGGRAGVSRAVAHRGHAALHQDVVQRRACARLRLPALEEHDISPSHAVRAAKRAQSGVR